MLFILTILLSILSVPILSISEDTSQTGQFVYNDHGKRDPLWPLVSSSGGTMTYDTDFLVTELNLEGIMVATGSEGNLAIINGRVLKEHENIGQFIIQKISSDTVILQKDTETFELKLKKEE